MARQMNYLQGCLGQLKNQPLEIVIIGLERLLLGLLYHLMAFLLGIALMVLFLTMVVALYSLKITYM